jgi:RNA polymerase sigma-70 factor (ECF subfamily)
MQKAMAEQELVKSLKSKKLSAFDTFYNQYAPAFYGDVRRMLYRQKDSDEALAQAFVSMWNAIHEYDSSKERLFTWSLKVVRKETSKKKVEMALEELFSHC